MPYFQWTGIDIQGSTRKGIQFSSSVEELEQELFAHEIAIYNVRQTHYSHGKKWKRNEVGTFFNHLAVLLKSGVFLTDALDIINSLNHKNHISSVIENITDQVHKGMSFSKALALHDNCFDQIIVSMIRAAEESGNIIDALESITSHIEFMEQFYKKLKSAALIPIVTLSFFVFIVAIVMVFIVPQFAALFQNHYQELPFVTRAMISLSAFLSNYLWTLIFLIIFLGLGLQKYLQTTTGQFFKRWLLFRIPYIKKIIIKTTIFSFLESLGLLLKEGISIVPAMSLASQIVQQEEIAQWCTQIEDQVKSGSSFHAALSRYEEIDKELIAMIKIGEESGRLPTMIEQSCRIYEASISQLFELITVLFQPIIMLLIGCFVATLIFALYVPLFQLSNTITIGF